VELSYSGSTKAMLNHLKHHETQPVSHSSGIRDGVKEITVLIPEMIAVDMQPLSMDQMH
jgi:hypothetical protein